MLKKQLSISFQYVTRKLLWGLWLHLCKTNGDHWVRNVVIDPEPLIAVTPYLSAGDTRLLRLAFDWCVVNERKIFKERVRGISKLLPRQAFCSFCDFAEVLSENITFGHSWSFHSLDLKPFGDPYCFDLSPDSESPSSLVFRIRSFSGVSVRADVLTRLLYSTPSGLDTESLIPWGSSRRSVGRVLKNLVLARQVFMLEAGRGRRFMLRDHDNFSDIVSSRDLTWYNWDMIFWFLMWFRGLIDEIMGLSDSAAQVSILSKWEILEYWAILFQVVPPRFIDDRNERVEVFLEWCFNLAEIISEGEINVQAPMTWLDKTKFVDTMS